MKPGQSSSTAHLPLAENPGFQPGQPCNADHLDHDISKALKTDIESARACPDRIQKTIRIDVERNAVENSADYDGSR